MNKDAAIAQVAASLAYTPYDEDPKRTKNSIDIINAAKDKIHMENKHLGLNNYKVVESNRDRFAMVSHSDKVVHIGNAGTRTSGKILSDTWEFIKGNGKTSTRFGDIMNDTCLLFTNHSLPGRQAKVNDMV
jgi:hypothetical protein